MGCAQATHVKELENYEVVMHKSRVSHSSDSSAQQQQVSWSSGETFHSSYTLSQKLGSGAFASVYLAKSNNAKVDEEVAVKVTDLRKDKTTRGFEGEDVEINEKRVKETKNEVTILSAIQDHANVIKCIDSYMTGSLSYVVLEKCDKSLWMHLCKMPQLNEATLKPLVRQMLTGIEAVHSVGAVHCDVKPDNFLVSNGIVKLCDFGLSRFVASGVSGVHGTAPFMAPEMLRGEEYGTGIDVWSVGCIAYTLMYGEFPYMPAIHRPAEMKVSIAQGTPAPKFAPRVGDAEGVSPAGKAFLKSLLSRRADKRPTAAAATQDLYWERPSAQHSLRPALMSARSVGAFEVRDLASQVTSLDTRLRELQTSKRLLSPSSTPSTASGSDSEVGSTINSISS